jgi:hypothetical protein
MALCKLIPILIYINQYCFYEYVFCKRRKKQIVFIARKTLNKKAQKIITVVIPFLLAELAALIEARNPARNVAD